MSCLFTSNHFNLRLKAAYSGNTMFPRDTWPSSPVFLKPRAQITYPSYLDFKDVVYDNDVAYSTSSWRKPAFSDTYQLIHIC